MKMQYTIIVFLLLCSISFFAFASGQSDAEQLEVDAVLQTHGPVGNDPLSYTEVQLRNSEMQQARAKKLKRAVLMHTSSGSTNSVITGVKDMAEKIDAEVVLVANVESDVNKKETDTENALVFNSDIFITLILDDVAAATAFGPVAEDVIKIALFDNLALGFIPGKASLPSWISNTLSLVYPEFLLGT